MSQRDRASQRSIGGKRKSDNWERKNNSNINPKAEVIWIKKRISILLKLGSFSFEVEIKELLGKVGDTICISTDGIDPDGFDVKITCIEEDYYVYCSMPGVD